VWETQLARLAAYKAGHGDCKVPWGWVEDPRLASWVSNQRGGKRKLDRGEPSPGMTAERAARLTALGFVWEPPHRFVDDAKWEAQLARLAAYKVAHGDCKVPQQNSVKAGKLAQKFQVGPKVPLWAEDPRLGEWVANQRKYKKKLDRGEPSQGMTTERVARLTALGFWSRVKEVAPRPRPAGRGSKRQKQAPGTAAPFMQLLR
jgi:hypothetical protein